MLMFRAEAECSWFFWKCPTVADAIHDDSLSFVDRKSFKGVVGSGPLLGVMFFMV